MSVSVDARAERDSPSHDLAADLTWLNEQRRVFDASQDPSLPLVQRLRSCAQTSDAVDRFVQERAARGDEQLDQGVASAADTVAARQLHADGRRALEALAVVQDEVFVRRLGPELAQSGIHLIEWAELHPDEQARMSRWFDRRVYPVLTPMAVDPGHPFPYISDLSLNLAVVVADEPAGSQHFARVKVPGSFRRFVGLAGGSRFVPVEQVIAAHLERLFTGMVVLERHPFRVTRDTGVSTTVTDSDTRRRRAGRVVRLEIHHSMPFEVRRLLQRELELEESGFHERIAPLDLRWLASIADHLAAPAPPSSNAEVPPPAWRRWWRRLQRRLRPPT